MKVVIEKLVAFDNSACRLVNVQTNDEVIVSMLQAQLLTLLIEFRGFAVSRNEIFEKVFDVNDAHSTNNNLNQNISILRKHLSLLGIELDVIKTIPRVGFMISDDIFIEFEDVVLNLPEDTLKKNKIKNDISWLSSNLFSVVIISITLIIVLVMSGLYTNNSIPGGYFPDNIPQLTYSKGSKVSGCDVYKLSVRGAGDALFNAEQFQDDIRDLRCDKPEHTQFFISKNSMLDNYYRTFTLKCLKTEMGRYDCYSIYHRVGLE